MGRPASRRTNKQRGRANNRTQGTLSIAGHGAGRPARINDMPLEYLLLIFVTLLGACVGSFLNVVILRLPAERSLLHPPSTCPRCEKRIAWYDNIPVVSWLILRGRCRHCGEGISGQYPLIEAMTAVLFGGVYAACYLGGTRPGFEAAGLGDSWPMLLAYLFLVGAMVSASAIDARHFVLPLPIMWLTALVGVLVGPVTAAVVFPEPLPAGDAPTWLPWAAGPQIGLAAGGTFGLIASLILLKLGYVPRSFDAPEFEPHENEAPDAFLAHPAPRTEVLKELLFVALPFLGGVAGYWIMLDRAEMPEPWLAALTGVLLGYLVGAAVVWATRVLGTLAFGKEAMGLGDVHLMAAVGAIAGWETALVAFFIAPFFGLAWTLASVGLARMLKREVRVIPYGPHLAAASLIVIVLREPLFSFLLELFGA